MWFLQQFYASHFCIIPNLRKMCLDTHIWMFFCARPNIFSIFFHIIYLFIFYSVFWKKSSKILTEPFLFTTIHFINNLSRTNKKKFHVETVQSSLLDYYLLDKVLVWLGVLFQTRARSGNFWIPYRNCHTMPHQTDNKTYGLTRPDPYYVIKRRNVKYTRREILRKKI